MIEQSLGEFQPQQMVTLRVGHSYRASLQGPNRLRQGVGRGHGRAGDLQRNGRGERQRATQCDQGATGGNVHGRSKLE